MKTDICPVCNGTGQVPFGFYMPEGFHFTGGWPETCKSCAGRGYVYVPEEDEYGVFGLLGADS